MNALTNCCHFPYFADGICPNCNNKCTPVPILEESWMEDKSRTYYAEPIPEPIPPHKEYIEPEKVARFKPNEDYFDLLNDR